MQIRTTIDALARLRVHEVSGDVDTDMILAELEKVYTSTDYDPEFRVLWDLREARGDSLTFDDIDQLGHTIGRVWGASGRGRAAFLVSGDLLFGQARQYESIVDPKMMRGTRVFRDHEAAVAWLRQ